MGKLRGKGAQRGKGALLAWLLCASVSVAQAAEVCHAVFSGGLQSHSTGSINFQWSSQLLDNPSPQLAALQVVNAWGAVSCGAVACQQAVSQVNPWAA